MKKILLFFAIVCVAFTSCNDDIFSGGRTTAKIGDKIDFSGSTKYETAGDKKRTVYGDKLTSATEIKWALGDAVRIYCAEAHGDVKECDYTVEGAFSNQTDQPPLKDKTDDSSYEICELSCKGEGLLWSTGAHNFYAVYPSPKMLSIYGEDTDVASAIKLEGNKVTATLPSVQRPRQYVAATDGNYIVHPAMRYAYMVAAAPGIDPSKNANVTLEFNPIVTAVEISLKNTGTATIEGITNVAITSDNELCGDFEVEISSGEITRPSTGNNYKSIQIPLVEQGTSVDLAPGNTITFTAFMMPNANLSSLKLTLLYANGVGQKQATISTTSNKGIIVEAKKKNFIANIPVNFSEAVSKVDLSKWAASISTLKDDATENKEMTLAKLSIPAAGGAASGHTDDWSTKEKYLEQNLTIEQLWDNGIRCFEFTVDDGSETAFKNQKVYCNSKPSNITLEEAVNKVKGKLMAYPSEFAMVIITYQKNNGWASRNGSNGEVSSSRSPEIFMNGLNNFWKSVGTSLSGVTKAVNTVDGQINITLGTALYKPDMKLSEARGKLFCIARPTSEKEDSYVEVSESNYLIYAIIKSDYSKTLPSVTPREDILVINGWGALKDKWEKRGYTQCIFKRGTGNKAFTNANKDRLNNLGNDDKPGRPFDVASSNSESALGGTLTDNYVNSLLDQNKLVADFTYTTSSTGTTAWVQEWARISRGTGMAAVTVKGETKGVWWPSSVAEKQLRIKESLDFALNKKINSTDASNYIFINSLCGYYIDTTIEDSYTPNSITEISIAAQGLGFELNPLTAASNTAGMSGNISDYAKDFNNYFYDYLLTKDLGGNSTGIIMMDRVSNDANANPAGYYIPRIILANNPFAPGQIAPEGYVPPVTGGGDDDIILAPARRDATDNEYSIVWK